MAKFLRRLKSGVKTRTQITTDSEVSNISLPTGFKHEWHAGYNSGTGSIDGLPPAWQMWLTQANIRLDSNQNHRLGVCSMALIATNKV